MNRQPLQMSTWATIATVSKTAPGQVPVPVPVPALALVLALAAPKPTMKHAAAASRWAMRLPATMLDLPRMTTLLVMGIKT
jgi:hypothetical protein